MSILLREMGPNSQRKKKSSVPLANTPARVRHSRRSLHLHLVNFYVFNRRDLVIGDRHLLVEKAEREAGVIEIVEEAEEAEEIEEVEEVEEMIVVIMFI